MRFIKYIAIVVLNMCVQSKINATVDSHTWELKAADICGTIVQITCNGAPNKIPTLNLLVQSEVSKEDLIARVLRLLPRELSLANCKPDTAVLRLDGVVVEKIHPSDVSGKRIELYFQ